MTARRALVVLILLLVATGLAVLLVRVLSPGGWTLAKLAMLAAFLATTPWTGLCVANGVIGFAVLVLCRDPVGVVCPVAEPSPASPGPLHNPAQRGKERSIPPTAIAVTVRNEEMGRVLASLRHLLHALDRLGAGDPFTLFILSDTQGAAATMAEEQAVEAFGAADRARARIRYRRRGANTGFKAGNIMDFLDTEGDWFELMLVLDADSEMSAEAVLRLVRAIQAEPSLAIVQHLTVGMPASSAFPRLFQFGMRAGMRTWSIGQAWWQGDEGPYWGHNAIIRIAPFRAHCRLPLLPGGRHILSHDQVEAAVLRGRGWGVLVLPEPSGSWEATPPTLPEFLCREMRWLAGNWQYWHLLRLPGLRAMGRFQLVQAILLFANIPFYLLFLLAAATAAATDAASPFPATPAFELTLAWLGALYAPKLLGYAEVALVPDKLACYGGMTRFAVGVLAELCFTLLLDALSAVAKTSATLCLALGAPVDWTPQNRNDRGVGWREATRLLWPQTLLGVLVLAGFASAGWTTTLWALPLVGGLLLAIPLCVVTADRRFGRWLREKQIAAIPEEIDPRRLRERASVVTVLALQPRARGWRRQ